MSPKALVFYLLFLSSWFGGFLVVPFVALLAWFGFVVPSALLAVYAVARVLAVVDEHDFTVRHVSANVAELLDRPVDAVLGHHLAGLIGADQAAIIAHASANFGDLRQRNPIECNIDVAGVAKEFDAILHRDPGGLLLVELEIAHGERPYSFPNTYQAVRSSVEDLNRASTLSELYDTTARAVRDLTGFDRVMVYRYDEDFNGEVVAESKRADLNSFLGLHYPSTDIPAQARALYEKNWIRLISDVDYTPAPLIPGTDAVTGNPLDLTYATLRSVSPIHIEYLKNMGVRASMSISLLRHGQLWGLIACHHYSGPHLPPFGSRAAAEFLGSTLSLRLVDQYEEDQLQRRLAAQEVLGELIVATLDDDTPLVSTLLDAPGLLDLVPADGVVVELEGQTVARGMVPPQDAVEGVVAWARTRHDEITATDRLADELPDLDLDPGVAAGTLVLDLSMTESLDEALSRIAAYAAAYPDRPWIIGRGWNQERWGLGRFPTAEELDAVVADRPVWLERVDGHAGWANSMALRAGGVSADTPDPSGGRVERLSGSRAPSGVLVDAAMAMVAEKEAAIKDGSFVVEINDEEPKSTM